MTTDNKQTTVTGFAQGATTTTPAATTTPTTTVGKGGSADALAALRAQLGQKAAGYHFHKGPEMYEVYAEKGVNFVVAKNGMFRVTATRIGIFASKVGDAPKANAIPGLADLKEGVTLTIPKIPFLHWLQVLTFYRDVHKQDGTEASVLFFWNHNNVAIPKHYSAAEGQEAPKVHGVMENGQLIVYCPKQRNSSGLSEFGMDTMVPWLRQHTTPLCETHSHLVA